MCLICIDLDREKLSSREARRNLGESYGALDRKHIIEVLKKIWKQEDKEADTLSVHDIKFEAYMRDCDV